MNYNVDEIILVKLITGEEIIGKVKKKFHDGGVTLDDVRIVLMNDIGCYMERFIPFCENNEYHLPIHAIMTCGVPIKELIDFFNKGDESTLTSVSIAMSPGTKH